MAAREQFLDMLFIVGRIDPGKVAELAKGRHLVTVAMLAPPMIPGQDDDRLAQFHGADQRAHAGVADHQRALLLQFVKLAMLDERKAAHGTRRIARGADLRDHVGAPVGFCPGIDGLDQAIERQLGAYRHEDHKMRPK